MTTNFTAIDGLPGVYSARRGKLCTMALRLSDQSFCLYSPVAGLETVLSAADCEISPVSALLAPNHYHNKGLAAHHAAFPGAALFCSDAARPRLDQLTGLSFDPLQELERALPNGVTLHEPVGVKTGEVWVKITSGKTCALIVTDAFSSPLQPVGQFGDAANLLGTFPRYGVKDAHAYTSWAIDFLSQCQPTLLLPCHGSPVRAADLTDQLITLLGTLR